MLLETISTMDHPSPAVEARKKQSVSRGVVQLPQAGKSRRQNPVAIARFFLGPKHRSSKRRLKKMQRLVEARKQGGDPACNCWDLVMTSIVAIKALLISEHEAWMIAKY